MNLVLRLARAHASVLFAAGTALMIIVGCLRIQATYGVFWQVWDEPFHIAAGMEWLAKGSYTYEPFHPPLARVMGALGPYLTGVRGFDAVITDPSQMWQEGDAILHAGGQYERNLALARLGILPFFIVTALVVAFWTRDLAGRAAALIATFLVTTMPPLLGHAGVATLDMASAAMMTLGFFALATWLRRPDAFRSARLGVALGLAALSKLPALIIMLAVGGLTALLNALPHLRRWMRDDTGLFTGRRWFTRPLIMLVLFALTVWAGYRFSAKTISNPSARPYQFIDSITGPSGALHDAAYFALEEIPVPALEFFVGLRDMFTRSEKGHLAYLYGDIRFEGWWYFYPLTLLLKTPLPFLVLLAAGFMYAVVEILRGRPHHLQLAIPIIAGVGTLAFGMASGVSNGIRQILGVYPLFAIAAGSGAVFLLRARGKYRLPASILVAVLLVWQGLASAAAHPDYLAYFNELAAGKPEEIVVDSDLDWGQDLKRLSAVLAERGVREISIMYNGSEGMDLSRFPLPPFQLLQPYQVTSGWVAISIYHRALGTRDAPFDQFAWLEEFEPVQRVGKSIWLYYIPESAVED